MSVYEQGFEKLGLLTAQVLLTGDDFRSPDRYRNLRATLDRLLELGTVPVLNENDAVSTRELETRDHGKAVFGDNDELSALVATKLSADLLVILSDVDGLFTANPARSTRAKRIPKVVEVTPEVEALADGGGARGRGGMATKLRAARLAAKGGVATVIANGRTPGILDAVLSGEDVGTVFLPVRPGAGR
jgi:glutamate 5-kinase